MSDGVHRRRILWLHFFVRESYCSTWKLPATPGRFVDVVDVQVRLRRIADNVIPPVPFPMPNVAAFDNL